MVPIGKKNNLQIINKNRTLIYLIYLICMIRKIKKMMVICVLSTQEIFIRMAQVEINTPAPNFTLPDYQGSEVTLAQFKEKQHVLLVFNRGFF
jgi:cytochrome oxidase Cu insertion factor (SCO1/SenC/PrrC family)